MEKESNTKRVLLRAADILAKRGAWTQGAFAKSTLGNNVDAKNPEAVCYCLLGAIMKAGGRVHENNVMKKFLKVENLANWNDASKRRKKEVIAALRGAAATIK